MLITLAVKKTRASWPVVDAVENLMRGGRSLTDAEITNKINIKRYERGEFPGLSVDTIQHARLALELAGRVKKVQGVKKPTGNGGYGSVWSWKS